MLDEEIPEKTIRVHLSNKLWIITHIKTQIKARQVIRPLYILYNCMWPKRVYIKLHVHRPHLALLNSYKIGTFAKSLMDLIAHDLCTLNEIKHLVKDNALLVLLLGQFRSTTLILRRRLERIKFQLNNFPNRYCHSIITSSIIY